MSQDRSLPTGEVSSRDGVSLAYDRVGEGPPLIVVVGAFNGRSTGAPLAAALSDAFTVFTYDRRGRGDSGDGDPQRAESEFDDLAAMIALAGGSASVFGFSSGALLALRAAAIGLPIASLVLFDPPVIVGDSRPPVPADIAERLKTLLDADKRGDAVELFQREVVGMPAAIVEKLRHAPFRPQLEAMAPSLLYDALLTTMSPDLLEVAAKAPTSTLVIAAGEAAPWLQAGTEAVATRLPKGALEIVAGLTHDIVPELLEPPVRSFLAR